jgi:hypothetical protein
LGWRAQDAYDRDERARLRALPWGERYDWTGIAFVLAVVLAGIVGFMLTRA